MSGLLQAQKNPIGSRVFLFLHINAQILDAPNIALNDAPVNILRNNKKFVLCFLFSYKVGV